jgi:hypothetical protein
VKRVRNKASPPTPSLKEVDSNCLSRICRTD